MLCFVTCIGTMRGGHGHFSEAHAERISQLVGSAGQTIDKLYMSKVACSYSKTGRDHKGVKTADVHKFLTGTFPTIFITA